MAGAVGKDQGAISHAQTFEDQPGAAGETHQIAPDDGQVLTTSQGVPIADDQNTLRAGDRGPALLDRELKNDLDAEGFLEAQRGEAGGA